MKRCINLLVAVVGAYAAIFAAAVAVAAVVNGSAINLPATSEAAVYAAETLPAPMMTTPASTLYFDGINEGVIAIGAYE